MAGKRRAVVFGSNGPEYSGRLKYSASDAESFAKVLASARCGFEVQRVKTDARPSEIVETIEGVAQDCSEVDTFVCYFSGHGDLVKGSLWLLLDGTKRDLVPTTAINASKIVAAMGWCEARNRLLILDCCNAGAAVPGVQLRGVEAPALSEVLKDIDSESFLLLAGSDRLESAVELEQTKSGFLTSRLCEALSDPSHETVDPVSHGVSITKLNEWLVGQAKEFNRANPEVRIPKPYLKGEQKGAFYLTVTAADWPNVQLEWPDGTTMAVLPIKPVDGYAFCIGKQPVTNRQYTHLIPAPEPVGDTREDGEWRAFHPLRDPRFNDPEQPVVCVTLQECQQYVDGVNSLGPHQDVTFLPTPALWDFAAFGTEYPRRDPREWQELKPQVDRASVPINVDKSGLPVNPLEIGNLIGNVWQWCAADPEQNTAALRGGSFLDDASRVVPFRDAFDVRKERIARADVGFRIAGLARVDDRLKEVRALLEVSPSLEDIKLVQALTSPEKRPAPPEPLPFATPTLPPGVKFVTPVRVLMAASPGLENEAAIVRETIARSWISEQITVNLQDWNSLVEEWRKSQPGAVQRHPPISPWDGVLLLAGTDAKAVHDLHDAAKNYVTLPARWLAYCIDGEAPAGWAGAVEWRFCAPEQFADRFWDDHQKMIPTLLHPRQRSDVQKHEIKNPYRGLESYRLDDAAFFYGRSNEVSELCRTLRERTNGLLAIQGPSGSGKSSLVRAGLLYRLSLDAIPGSHEWLIVDGGRTESQMAGIAKALFADSEAVKSAYPSADDVEAALGSSDRQGGVVKLALQERPRDARLVLYFDQFEEMFRLAPDAQASFARSVLELCAHPRVNVVITIRADFYTQLMGTVLGTLAAAQWPFCLRPANANSVYMAIYWPVKKSGLQFEDESLAAKIQEDAGDDAGTLPLLSYAMQQFVDKILPGGLKITYEVFKSFGGVKGVIVSRADEIFKKHSPSKETVNGLFGRLVFVNEDGTPTKMPAVFDPAVGGWTCEEASLMRSLVDARLLITDKPDKNAPSFTVEIAHEALITKWPELKGWVERYRFQRLQIQQVENAAREWKQALQDVRKNAMRAASPAGSGQQSVDAGTASSVEQELEINRQHLWSQERLNLIRAAMQDLTMTEDALPPEAREFIRDERDRLIDELQYPISHDRRLEIGIRVSELGDPRPGIRVLDDDRPEILWCEVPPGEITLLDKDGNSLGTFGVPEHLFISRYELSLGQFLRFTSGQQYYDPEYWSGLAMTPDKHRPYPQATHKTYPAQFVSWYQAIAYCRWVSKKLGYEVRLPTEWEWVRAATGRHPEFLYPWGKDWYPDRLVYAQAGERGRSLRASGLYPKVESPVGALDMCGNVFEWCLNEFERITVTDVSGDKRRTTRGGAFFSPPEHCTVRYRLADPPDAKKDENQRIAVAIRLVAVNPPADALYYKRLS